MLHFCSSQMFSGWLALNIEVHSPHASFPLLMEPSGSKTCGILGKNSVDDTKRAVLSIPQVFVLICYDGAPRKRRSDSLWYSIGVVCSTGHLLRPASSSGWGGRARYLAFNSVLHLLMEGFPRFILLSKLSADLLSGDDLEDAVKPNPAAEGCHQNWASLEVGRGLRVCLGPAQTLQTAY